MTGKRLTLKEIAELAGVSLTTASMYLNGKAKRYNLSEATCERLERVMREHHFVPNFHARAIASKKTFLIGVLIAPVLESSFWLNILSGLEEVLVTRNYHLLLSVSRGDPAREAKSLQFMQTKGVDGIIINPVNPADSKALQTLAKSLPVVTLNMVVPGVPGVWNDNFAGGLSAVNYLLDRGHRRIAYIGVPVHRRIAAYQQAMRERGLEEHFFRTVAQFMEHWREFTAVLCFSDYQLLELYQSGLRIPEDISAIGYDEMNFVKLLNPPPVTVAQYKNELGVAAGEMILRLIDDPSSPDRETSLIPHLVPGASVLSI